HVVHRVEQGEPRDPVRDETLVDEPHEVGMCHLPRDEAETGDELQRRVRHGRMGTPDPLPWILAMVADGYAHVGTAGEVDRAQTDAVEYRCYLQDLPGREPRRAPQTLVAVADRHVHQLNGCHDEASKRTRMRTASCSAVS